MTITKSNEYSICGNESNHDVEYKFMKCKM